MAISPGYSQKSKFKKKLFRYKWDNNLTDKSFSSDEDKKADSVMESDTKFFLPEVQGEIQPTVDHSGSLAVPHALIKRMSETICPKERLTGRLEEESDSYSVGSDVISLSRKLTV